MLGENDELRQIPSRENCSMGHIVENKGKQYPIKGSFSGWHC